MKSYKKVGNVTVQIDDLNTDEAENVGLDILRAIYDVCGSTDADVIVKIKVYQKEN